MNNASLRYDLENIDNLRHLLCLAHEFMAETGMVPAELEYHGVRLRYNRTEAAAVIRGAVDEQAYMERNKIVE